MKKLFFVIAASMAFTATIFAQERKDKAAVTYEELYDEPYSVNKLFVAFQPLYGELFVTNVNAGFGGEVSYYYQDKADFRAHFRKTYSQQFFDFARDQAIHNSDVSDGWERESENEVYFNRFSEKIAYPLAINVIFYLMTH